MLIYTTESRSFALGHNITCTCELPIPDLNANPNQAAAMGKSYSEKNEKLDEFFTEIYFPQYTRELKGVIEQYSVSDLPQKFLYGLSFVVRPLPIQNEIYAFYCFDTDTITINADTLVCGAQTGSGRFICGHEIGHKIVHNMRNSAETISEVCSILMISDVFTAREILCDAFGQIVAPNDFSRFNACLERNKCEGLERAALKLAWSC